MPFAGRFTNTRRDERRSPVRRFSRSPVRRFSRSPIRRKSRSPVRRKSRSPIRHKSRSPVRKNSPARRRSPAQRNSPVRRSSPVRRDATVRRHSSPQRNSRSPVVRKYDRKDRKSRSPTRKKVETLSYTSDKKNDSSINRKREDRNGSKSSSTRFEESNVKRARSFSRSPVRKMSPEYSSSRAISDRLGSPPVQSGPKIIRDTTGISRFEPLIIRKRTLDERFRTIDDGAFKIEENITIGIQRNPYAPASASVTVRKVFDALLFSMIHNRDTGRRPVFDRPELKYFRFDDMSHDDTVEFEKRIIKVAPPATLPSTPSSSRYSHIHISKRSPSPKRPTEVKLEMRPDPKYERFYQDSLHEPGPSFRDKVKQAKIITNPNDLRHNLSKRQEEDARMKLEARRRDTDRDPIRGSDRSRERNRSRSRSRGRRRSRDNRQVESRDRNNSVTDSKDLPDFSRRPDKNKYEQWQNIASYIPKGISYYQSSGKAMIIRSIKGYVSNVSENFSGFKKKIEHFSFNFYTENEYIKGISFNPNFWNTLKTVDGSTCLGVMLNKVKLRPPKDWKDWNLVIDRFTHLEAMLMPFDLKLETRNLGSTANTKDAVTYDYDSHEDNKSSNGNDVDHNIQKHDTRESDIKLGAERRTRKDLEVARANFRAQLVGADPRDSKPPPKVSPQDKHTRSTPGRGGGAAGRGRNIMDNKPGRGGINSGPWKSHLFNKNANKNRNLADRGKWKHDMFEQQVKAEKTD